jgi:hypothetical protein
MVPRFVVLPDAASAKIQFNKAFAFSEALTNLQEFSFTDLKAFRRQTLADDCFRLLARTESSVK